MKEEKFEFGDKVHVELSARPGHELACCHGQLNPGSNATLEHVYRVIQSFVDALSDCAPFEWSNQQFFVTSLRAWDCIADSM